MSNVIPMNFRPNLGPGALLDKDDRFALSSPIWAGIQRYAQAGLALPSTDATMRTALGMAAGEPIATFTPLVLAYADIKSHCQVWKDQTYPSVVSIATDVISYARKAPTYYKPLLDLLPGIIGGDKEKEKEFEAILTNREKEAQAHADSAAKAYVAIERFALDTVGDKKKVDELSASYTKSHGATSDDNRKLLKDIEEQLAIIKKETADYEFNVTVAATTPTYAWVSFIGLGIAIVVAAVHGDRAVKALERLRAAQAKAELLQSKQQQAVRLLTQIGQARVGLEVVREQINSALPLIQQAQGMWNGLAADLAQLKADIKTDIRDVEARIKKHGIEAVLKSWDAVGVQAGKFRDNAFITVETKAA